ncbi:DMT family transporter [Reinekea sp.]|jgi:drug/metabolite transporter (DMT)-like permease|uniref:DMT family transporter n=1 Tax=Reinekea sp. TaxID=1970455 RepID=UPI002A838B5E|nr:DMT family transporter [Reinekea sp.]
MDWIGLTIFAALMQAVRTAGQKQLTSSLSAIASTWARYGFGLPLALIYFLIVWQQRTDPFPDLSLRFSVYVSLAAGAQLLATLLLVKVLSLRNFSVGTTYAKTEGILAALLGTALFGALLHPLAWLAIGLGIAGVLLVSVSRAKVGLRAIIDGRTACYGLMAGAGFALTALWVRAASLELSTDPLFSAALILLLSILLQGSVCSLLVHRQNPDNWRRLAGNVKVCAFVGLTGTLGSIGWYSAFALQEAAIVKSLGQVEFIFTLLLTYFFFKERISRQEWIGILLVMASVILLLWAV